MDILFLQPEYKDYIWGGTKLKENFNKIDCEFEKIAESWEVSANKNGSSVIKNGELKGKTLQEVFCNKELRKEIFGTKLLELESFPVLIKFIDAQANLSVQVHPNDEFANKLGHLQGKNEMWYIIDCKEDAKIVCGLKESKKDLKEIIESDEIEQYLNYINVKKGDCIYIEAGTIHAVLEGILICEVQQNSDITYRVYDWNRKDKNGKSRELHKEKALQVINLKNKCNINHTEEGINATLIKNDKFNVEVINVNDSYKDKSDVTKFFAYNVIEGEGFIYANNTEYQLKIGQSFIVPANIGEYKIIGKLKLIKTHI